MKLNHYQAHASFMAKHLYLPVHCHECFSILEPCFIDKVHQRRGFELEGVPWTPLLCRYKILILTIQVSYKVPKSSTSASSLLQLAKFRLCRNRSVTHLVCYYTMGIGFFSQDHFKLSSSLGANLERLSYVSQLNFKGTVHQVCRI